jgi:hypothetical protein
MKSCPKQVNYEELELHRGAVLRPFLYPEKRTVKETDIGVTQKVCKKKRGVDKQSRQQQEKNNN